MHPEKHSASENYNGEQDCCNAHFFIRLVIRYISRRCIRKIIRFVIWLFYGLFILFSIHYSLSRPVTYVLYLSTRIGNKTVI